MPSPFPGMDPFIEAAFWQTFHNRFIVALGDILVPQLRPGYAMDIGQDIYLVQEDGATEVREPDLAIVEDAASSGFGRREALASVGGVTLQPVAGRIPLAHERRHRYVEIRNMQSNEVITVVELLSPTNKVDRRGRKKYLAKRQDLVENGVNLVELDLLRRGRRLPINPAPPPHDYVAIVCRASTAPDADVYAWSLRDPLPSIPVPLADADPDVMLDLRSAFNETYDRLRLGARLSYREKLTPPIPEVDRELIEKITSRSI